MTSDADPKQRLLRKFWASPTRAKLMCYDISLALLPTIVIALGTASTVRFMKNPQLTLRENLCFLLRDPYFVAVFVLYLVITVMVIRSHKHIATIECHSDKEKDKKEKDKAPWKIAFYVIAPLFVLAFAQKILETLPPAGLAITLLLSALVAYTSQHHLSIPLSYREKGDEKPIPSHVHATVVGLIVNLLLLVAVCVHIRFSDVPLESAPGCTANKDVTGNSA